MLTTAVLAGVGVLLLGLGVAVAVQTRGHGTSDGARDAAASSPVASQGEVQPSLPVAIPSASGTGTSKQGAGGAKKTSPSPSAASGVLPSQGASATVAPAVTLPQPLGHWRLGAGGLGKDETGRHPAQSFNVGTSTEHGGAGVFNGQNSQVLTKAVVDTGPGHSFTVSAWAYLGSTHRGDLTVVSQDGTQDSGFFLQYSGPTNRWSFSRVQTDGAPSDVTRYRAVSIDPPPVNTWTHLVGVYDATDGEMTLYVNGVRQSTARDIYPFETNLSFVIGRARWRGDQGSQWFLGQISDVQVFGQALTDVQVRAVE
ncbi:hypothetical protein RVR_2483 [Actinacidiphila reveromycinica]|uniref:LamG-like jellyroll fold domain-containing protein n=1 Tax=Actinacidiphila reveromycinica TaxID=659352 RepID=A0A7U3VMV6_9ACTN|nr:LamG domain-containing protein [Streptomyces sp. SN-593]BBA96949.1 hypothetical protein RVR_2483 [Streptomyces sp. SN-593]